MKTPSKTKNKLHFYGELNGRFECQRLYNIEHTFFLNFKNLLVFLIYKYNDVFIKTNDILKYKIGR